MVEEEVEEEEEEGKSVEWVKWHDEEMETRNRGQDGRIKKNKEGECEQGEPICCNAEQTTLGLSTTVTADDDCW